MTDIEKKALVLLNEVEPEIEPWTLDDIKGEACFETLCRAIEQHEAFRQEVSDAVEDTKFMVETHCDTEALALVSNRLNRFIIAKPDPLAEAWIEATGNTVGMEPLNEALAKRGGKIVWREGH